MERTNDELSRQADALTDSLLAIPQAARDDEMDRLSRADYALYGAVVNRMDLLYRTATSCALVREHRYPDGSEIRIGDLVTATDAQSGAPVVAGYVVRKLAVGPFDVELFAARPVADRRAPSLTIGIRPGGDTKTEVTLFGLFSERVACSGCTLLHRSRPD